ncbi:MAG: hypothetical protein F6K24_14920 [Okeania sp. SIO2D1]|nr:hypothetical protein [Okeania sp. SIO2D1]
MPPITASLVLPLVGYRVEIYSRGVMLLRSGALFGDRSSAEVYAKSAIDGMT